MRRLNQSGRLIRNATRTPQSHTVNSARIAFVYLDCYDQANAAIPARADKRAEST